MAGRALTPIHPANICLSKTVMDVCRDWDRRSRARLFSASPAWLPVSVFVDKHTCGKPNMPRHNKEPIGAQQQRTSQGRRPRVKLSAVEGWHRRLNCQLSHHGCHPGDGSKKGGRSEGGFPEQDKLCMHYQHMSTCGDAALAMAKPREQPLTVLPTRAILLYGRLDGNQKNAVNVKPTAIDRQRSWQSLNRINE